VGTEILRVFDRSWLYVGHESEIPKAGDFVTRQIAGRPVILVRGTDDVVRVLLNSCTHRGAEVCRQLSGNAKLFVCPYHSWTFQTDGKLRGVFLPEAYPQSFNKAEMGLKSAPCVDLYRGLVFASFDSTIEPLFSYLAGARDVLDLILDQGEDGMEIVAGTHEYSVKANWKLLVENSVEGYHAPSTHARYFQFLERQQAKLGEIDRRGTRGADLGNGHGMMTGPALFARPVALWAKSMGEAARAPVEAVAKRLEERFGVERARRIGGYSRNLFIYPNLIINDVQAITVRTFYPVSPGEIAVSSWALASKNEPAELRRVRLDSYLTFLGPGGFATPDDVELLESCQRSFGNKEVEWSEMSRDIHEPEPKATGDEQLRSFWRRWNEMMNGGDERAARSAGDRPRVVA
jgi:phenylpropionate dioxygenase-like ring-hydroxylating dioxygenase large terminal subunit